MSQDLKQIIREEYIHCSKDPAHFMKKYCNIQHPQRGRVIFNLYPFKETVLRLWRDNPYSIVLKSRQLGISTLAAGYSLWLMLFHKDKNILCIATKQETAKNMVTKVKFMFDNLPSWLKIGFEENNKLTLRLNNGSQIKATSANSDAGRSEAVSLLLVDEAAFIEQIGEIWASAQQT
jgi:phage FluMu gp28-like protein